MYFDMYKRPKEEATPLSDEEIQQMWLAYELGIDPGMGTWNATVRRNLLTGEEVTFKK